MRLNFAKLFLLLVWNLHCTVFMTAATAEGELPQNSVEKVEVTVEEEEDDLPGPQASAFEGDILITLEQLQDHYGVPSDLDDEPKPLSQVGSK